MRITAERAAAVASDPNGKSSLDGPLCALLNNTPEGNAQFAGSP